MLVILPCLRQVEGYLRSCWTRIICSGEIASGVALVQPIDVHGALYLPLKLLLHLRLRILLLSWIKDAHGFKVESADTSHECFLEILLHHVLVSIHDCL